MLCHQLQGNALTAAQVTDKDPFFQPGDQPSLIHFWQKMRNQHLPVFGMGQLGHERLEPGVSGKFNACTV